MLVEVLAGELLPAALLVGALTRAHERRGHQHEARAAHQQHAERDLDRVADGDEDDPGERDGPGDAEADGAGGQLAVRPTGQETPVPPSPQ